MGDVKQEVSRRQDWGLDDPSHQVRFETLRVLQPGKQKNLTRKLSQTHLALGRKFELEVKHHEAGAKIRSENFEKLQKELEAKKKRYQEDMKKYDQEKLRTEYQLQRQEQEHDLRQRYAVFDVTRMQTPELREIDVIRQLGRVPFLRQRPDYVSEEDT